jgi:predicted ATPase/class 3 adenylate cyclase
MWTWVRRKFLRHRPPQAGKPAATCSEAGLRRLKEPAGCPLGVGLCHPLPRVYPPGSIPIAETFVTTQVDMDGAGSHGSYATLSRQPHVLEFVLFLGGQQRRHARSRPSSYGHGAAHVSVARDTMTNQNELFGRLLRGAISSIAACEGKTAAVIEEELGAAIGLSGATIQRYKNGMVPPETRTIEILAEAAVQRGFLGRVWLQRFLQAAQYPAAETLLVQLIEGSPTVSLPGGTLIFLFTDIEGSSAMWERDSPGMMRALNRHNTIIRQAIEAQGGHIFKTVGDAFYAAFVIATDALEAAVKAQQLLAAEPWQDVGPLRVRMALHAGAAVQRDDDYFGPPLNRVARLCAAGHGGQILLSSAVWELVRDQLPAGVALRDLNEHRLKDLGRPERVYQVLAPGLAAEFPPLRGLDRYHHNLPVQATPLIGREAEVRSVCERFRQDTTRLLTLTGPGGVGKTRLALEVAAQLLDDARDGVWYVPLAAFRDPGLVVPAIAEVLNVTDSGGLPLAERLKRFCHQKQFVLVLDNFEQISSAAPLVAELLAAAPELKIVSTSRERLHIYGEQEYAVSPLAVPDPARLPSLARLTQYEAVRLFIERARAVKPDFVLTDATAPAVAEICARLDGLPLAIELAAARSRIFTPQALLTRLTAPRHRLSFLQGGARDLPARQQTLRNAIAWSYDLLEVREQTLLARLGVFAGGFTLEAVEAICASQPLAEVLEPPDEVDAVRREILHELASWAHGTPALLVALEPIEIPLLLESLASKSLLKTVGESNVPRFTMLETIREYARERLTESGEEEALRWRHAAYYAWFFCANDVGSHPQGIALLEDELENLRAALLWSHETGEDLPGLVIGRDCQFWGERTQEGLQWLRPLLQRELPTSYATAYAWYSAAWLAFFDHDYPPARVGIEMHYRMLGELGHATHSKAWNLGWIALGEQDVDGAGVLFEQFLQDERSSLNRDDQLAWGEYGLGSYCLMANKLDAAQSHLEASLEIFRRINMALAVIDALQKLGLVAQAQGDLRRAVVHLRTSIEHATALSYRHGIAECLFGFACVALQRGKLKMAARWFGAAEALSQITSGMDPDQDFVRDQAIAALHAQLDYPTLTICRNEGRALPHEQAVMEVLAFAAAMEDRGELLP